MAKNNGKALNLLIVPAILASFMFWTLDQSLPLYLLGQVAGILFFMQSFILLHEFGHNSFFKTSALNTFFGHIISYFVFIPFWNWRQIHDLHHKWTGWRDRDPTTEKTFSARLSPKQTKLINFCWKYHVPLFTIGYRLGIYWKLEKLKRHLSQQDYRICVINMLGMMLVYATLAYFFWPKLVLLIPAVLFSFVLTDVISLSQHSNIEMPVSEGKDVSPLKYVEQARYSRSLILPPLISEYIVFNFNYHEAHHCYPGLPCYYLPRINHGSSNAYAFWPWLKKVKSIPGVDFVFMTSKDRSQF